MLVKEEKYGPYSLHTIKTDRFKTCHIEIIFRNQEGLTLQLNCDFLITLHISSFIDD